ncbi:hypothetical protein C8R45DRAFT_926670 [Mycena sanguinolenta]|nr:hypothetical protein C8R45DRAFT_926670 [Mycena sanguinolenta]
MSAMPDNDQHIYSKTQGGRPVDEVPEDVIPQNTDLRDPVVTSRQRHDLKQSVLDALVQLVQSVLDALAQLAQSVRDALVQFAQSVLNALVQLMQSVLDGMYTLANSGAACTVLNDMYTAASSGAARAVCLGWSYSLFMMVWCSSGSRSCSLFGMVYTLRQALMQFMQSVLNAQVQLRQSVRDSTHTAASFGAARAVACAVCLRYFGAAQAVLFGMAVLSVWDGEVLREPAGFNCDTDAIGLRKLPNSIPALSECVFRSWNTKFTENHGDQCLYMIWEAETM